MKAYTEGILGLILIFLPIIVAFILGWIYTSKIGLCFYTIYSLMMFVNIIMTTLSNAVLNRTIDGGGVLFWKIYYTLTSSVCISLLFL